MPPNADCQALQKNSANSANSANPVVDRKAVQQMILQQEKSTNADMADALQATNAGIADRQMQCTTAKSDRPMGRGARAQNPDADSYYGISAPIPEAVRQPSQLPMQAVSLCPAQSVSQSGGGCCQKLNRYDNSPRVYNPNLNCRKCSYNFEYVSDVEDNNQISPTWYFDSSQPIIGKNPVVERRIWDNQIPKSLTHAVFQWRDKKLNCKQPCWGPECL